jgi:Cys-rich four helix bundle protein (predicted Tat secretion target)
MKNTMDTATFTRRSLLGVSIPFGLAGLSFSAATFAEKSAHDGHHMHGAHAAATNPEVQAIVDTSLDCVKTGRACAQHCVEMFQMGHNTMKNCYAAVEELIVSCDALAQLAQQNSAHLREFMLTCTKVCASCEKMCRKYENDYRQCKDCAESCKACLKACNDYLAA